MTKLAISLTAALLLIFLGQAQATSISSTVLQDNGTTNNPAPPTDGNQSLYVGHPAVITSGNGYNFGSSYTSLTSISRITITLTVFDGDSGLGNFDLNHLHLYLGGTATFTPNPGSDPHGGQNLVSYSGGIDTGLILNGFRGGGFIDTLTLSILVDPNTTGSAILSALSTNGGTLPAFIVTDNTNDTAVTPNEVGLFNGTNSAVTTLVLSDVPEPTTFALAGVGLLLIIAPRIRRLRRPE